MPYDAFISYSHDDGEEAAEQLKAQLKRAYLDKHGNRGGAEWEKRIRTAIKESAVFFFLITPGSIQSDYCQKEWNWALEFKKPIVPVLIKKADEDKVGAKYAEFYDIVHRRQYISPDEARGWQDYYLHLGRARHALGRSFQHVIDSVQYIDTQVEERSDAVVRDDDAFIIRTVHGLDDTSQQSMSIEAAWKEYEGQLLLLGEPGAGKTTMLLRHAQTLIAAYVADAANKTPFYANIAQWPADKDIPIAQWLSELYRLPPNITRYITHGEAVLILDGLDELGSSRPIDPRNPEKGSYDPRARFMKQLQPLIERGDQVLITCRVRDYEAIGHKFEDIGAVELKPLTDDDVRTYLQNYPELQATIFGDEALLEICRRPLILSLIAFGFRDAPQEAKALGKLSEGALRDAIFERYVNTIYHYEKERRAAQGETMPFSLKQIWQALGHAAMINVAGGRRRDDGSTIEENVLIEADFRRYLATDDIEAFCQLACDLHLLYDNQNGSYSFLHLLLRDTFAYPYSIDNLRNADLYYQDYFELYPSPAKALGNLGDARAVQPLITVLQDKTEDSDMRRHAASALGEIGDARAIEPLINALRDEDTNVRFRAAEALGQIGEPAFDPLITILQDKTDNSDVRSGAAYALGQIGDARAFKPLLTILQDKDEDNEVRSHAAVALGLMGKPALPHLIAIFRDKDEDSDVRSSAADALGNLGEPALPHLISILQDKEEDESMRRHAAFALINIGNNSVVNLLINILQDKTNGSLVRADVIQALVALGGASTVEILIEALYDENSEVRILAADALGRIGDTRAFIPLLVILQDKTEDSDMRYWVAGALGELNDIRAFKPLITILQDKTEDSDVRRRAADALGEIGDARAVRPLIDALSDEDSDVRGSAVSALGRLGDGRAVQPLIDTLRDESVRSWAVLESDIVGDHAADILGKIGEPALSHLVAVLQDKTEVSGVRSRAARALRKIGTREALEAVQRWEEQEK